MYAVTFCEANDALQATSTTLECQRFSEAMHKVPSDRHAYVLRYLVNPIR